MYRKGAIVMILDEERLRSAAMEAARLRRAGFDALEPVELENVRERKRPRIPLRRAVIAAAIIGVLLSLTLPTVSASVRFWFKEPIWGGSEYVVTSEAKGIDVEHGLTILPEGYEESERIERTAYIIIRYKNSNGDIIELICSNGGEEFVFSLTNDYIITQTYVGDYEAEFYLSTSKSFLNAIIWFDTDREIMYILNADLSEEVMVKLAESAK